jgi:hypothetical protein
MLLHLSPEELCAGEPIAPRLKRTVERKLRKTRVLVGRAARALAQGQTGRGHRTLQTADHQLQGLLTLVTRPPNASWKIAPTATSVACRQLLEQRVARVLGAMLRLPF